MSHESNQKLSEEISNAEEQVIVGGIYRHYKQYTKEGKLMDYVVKDIVLQEEDESSRVIYKSLYDGLGWSRSLTKFIEFVEVDGKMVPRFTLISKPE